MEVIYVITTLAELKLTEPGFLKTKDTRCVGWYLRLCDAIRVLQENKCDLNEAGSYPYAIVECTSEGIYPETTPRLWFKYDATHDGYVQIDEPECVRNFSNFGIG